MHTTFIKISIWELKLNFNISGKKSFCLVFSEVIFYIFQLIFIPRSYLLQCVLCNNPKSFFAVFNIHSILTLMNVYTVKIFNEKYKWKYRFSACVQQNQKDQESPPPVRTFYMRIRRHYNITYLKKS